DARDPQPAHVALALLAIAVRVRERVHDRLVGGLEQAAVRPREALGELEHLLVTRARGDASLDPGHDRSSESTCPGTGRGVSRDARPGERPRAYDGRRD